MMHIDWAAVALGLIIGAPISAIFFAGLGLGIGIALRTAKPTAVLMLSATVRISLLLGVGSLIAGAWGAWCLAGYAAAFLIVRFVTTTVAKVGMPPGGLQ